MEVCEKKNAAGMNGKENAVRENKECDAVVYEENAIEVHDVKKGFRLYYDKSHTLKDKTLHRGRSRYQEREVLKGISFSVKKGEALGLIGHNGCGKSTMLKLLTRIMYPDEGSIELRGRVSSLLELGAGFHPDMSGRENIYINASIFGLKRKEIDLKIGSIIEFSELEAYIDNPVRTYSSGMYMRLAFSVAINVNADILLIDEILAVGDVNFQSKCFNRLMEIKGTGTTIVIVSHSMDQIERICDRSIWIKDGNIQKEGTPVDVHRAYLDHMARKREQAKAVSEGIEKSGQESGDEKVEMISACLFDENGNKKKVFHPGDAMKLELELNAKEIISDYLIEINLVRADGIFCCGCSTVTDEIKCTDWTGHKKMMLSFLEISFLTGKYHFDLHIAKAGGGTILFAGNAAEFEIIEEKPGRGLVYLEHRWLEK